MGAAQAKAPVIKSPDPKPEMGSGGSKQGAVYTPTLKLPSKTFTIHPRFATGGFDGRVKIFNAEDGSEELDHLVEEEETTVTSVLPLPGDRIATSSHDGVIRIFNFWTGVKPVLLDASSTSSARRPSDPNLKPYEPPATPEEDEKRRARKKLPTVMDAALGRTKQWKNKISDIRMLPGGYLAAALEEKRVINIFDSNVPDFPHVRALQCELPPKLLAVLGDGRLVAMCGEDEQTNVKELKCWDALAGNCTMTTRSEDWSYTWNTIAASYQNRLLRTGQRHSLLVWDPDTGKTVQTINVDQCMSLAVLGDGLIAVGTSGGDLLLLNATSGNRVCEFHRAHSGILHLIAGLPTVGTPDLKVVTAGHDGFVHLFNVSEKMAADHKARAETSPAEQLAWERRWDDSAITPSSYAASQPKMKTRPQQAGYVKVIAALPASGPHLKRLVETLQKATELPSINVVNLIASYLVGEVFLRR